MMDMLFCHLTSQCFETDKPTERNMGILCARYIFENLKKKTFLKTDDPGVTLTYFMARSNLVIWAFQ